MFTIECDSHSLLSDGRKSSLQKVLLQNLDPKIVQAQNAYDGGVEDSELGTLDGRACEVMAVLHVAHVWILGILDHVGNCARNACPRHAPFQVYLERGAKQVLPPPLQRHFCPRTPDCRERRLHRRKSISLSPSSNAILNRQVTSRDRCDSGRSPRLSLAQRLVCHPQWAIALPTLASRGQLPRQLSNASVSRMDVA